MSGAHDLSVEFQRLRANVLWFAAAHGALNAGSAKCVL